MFRFVALTVMVIVFIFSGCASQDEMFMIDDRLSSLEQRHDSMDRRVNSIQSSISTVEKSQSEDEQSLRGQFASMRVSMNEMRAEIQKLNGRLEEALFKFNRRMTTLENSERKRQQEFAGMKEAVEENTSMIQQIETYLNFEKAAKATAKPTAAAETPPPEKEKVPQDDQLYISAKQAFDRGELEAARKGFIELINKYPKSKHSDNAQFWIGETYYRDKWYEKAILEYQKVIEKYPKGNKVQASLLKQGFSFANLGDASNARLILKELIRKYPKSNEAAIARKKLEGLR